MLEAAAAEKPLITTNVGGIPEIYGPLSGTLIEAGNVDALAFAIARSIENPVAAADLAAALRSRVATSFSVDAMVDGVISAYHQAMTEAIPLRDAALAAK